MAWPLITVGTVFSRQNLSTLRSLAGRECFRCPPRKRSGTQRSTLSGAAPPSGTACPWRSDVPLPLWLLAKWLRQFSFRGHSGLKFFLRIAIALMNKLFYLLVAFILRFYACCNFIYCKLSRVNKNRQYTKVAQIGGVGPGYYLDVGPLKVPEMLLRLDCWKTSQEKAITDHILNAVKKTA